MLNAKKNKSVVSMLRDRELNLKYAPYFLGLKIISQVIRSDKESLYSNTWKKSSTKEIAYDSGNLYFSNYKQYCSVNVSDKKPPPLYEMERTSRRKRVSDVISYSGISVCKSICHCQSERCICLSQYLLSISEDNWLCQHYMANGKLMKQIYVNLFGQNIKFKYCDWDMYGERFILTTTRKPFTVSSPEKCDVVAYLAVFTTFPIEFFALMGIKRSVFGNNLSAVSISHQSLIIGLGSYNVAIYSFDDFLKEGTLIPYKLGDPYQNKGEIGSYPTGLPLNFTYTTAPPVLFNVKCLGQIVRFGGYPYHYITIHPTHPSEFRIASVATDTSIETNNRIEPGLINDLVDTVVFHPDQSNRIIFKRDNSIDIYKIIAENQGTNISKLYSMELLSETQSDSMRISSYGRKIKSRLTSLNSFILCSDYEDQLEIFAVLAKYLNEDSAFILLYDSKTGEELRSIPLKGKFCDSKLYHIYIDLYVIIVIERDLLSDYTVHVYIM